MKLSRIASFLQDYYSKVRAKGEERIKNTLITYQNLSVKKEKYKETQGFKIDYALPIEDQFNFFSYKKSKNFPGVVNLCLFNDYII